MKTTPLISSLVFFAFALISSARAADTPVLAQRPSYAVTVCGTVIALLPADKASTTDVTSDSATQDKVTGIVTLTGNVKIVIISPGKDPITICGDEIALVPQRWRDAQKQAKPNGT